jgi:L-rhamnose mutarotase
MRDEYKKRHDEIWPELSELLVKAGVRDYSIFLDQDTNFLFAVMWREEDHKMDQLRSELIMKKWWSHMSDIMDTDKMNEPITKPLEMVFHMK